MLRRKNFISEMTKTSNDKNLERLYAFPLFAFGSSTSWWSKGRSANASKRIAFTNLL